jgi:very-short-patch-repair endonuclease
MQALTSVGYQVRPQVGAGGFRIDLGVVDDKKPGRYLLGIECDGASYHSAQSARDRDRIRQEVLERLGWRIHRIWSTDWFREPEKETKRAIEAIEKARVYWAGKAQAALADRPRSRVPATSEIPRTKESAHQKEPLKAVPYKLANLRIRLGQRQLHELTVNELARYVEVVVDEEAPVHIDQVVARITAGAGLHRAGNRIRKAVDAAIKRACWNKKASKRGHFLYKPDAQFAPRDRIDLPQQDKKLDYIAPEEILMTLAAVVKGAFRISMDDAIASACRMLGFRRVSLAMAASVKKLINKRGDSLGIQHSGDELVWQGASG